MTTSDTEAERLPVALRTEALESILVERGVIDPAVMDKFIKMYEQDIGPLNGAKVVARAWVDPEYKARLLEDGTGSIAELGFKGAQGEHIVVLENTPGVHNVVVCTLCSCYPWPVLGLPPAWYKDPAYRSRMVREPRTLLAELGLALGDDVDIQVWDSVSEVRYFVLPERPAGTDGLSEEELAALVTRDAMVGVAKGRNKAGDNTVVTSLAAVLDVDGPAAPPRSNGELVFGAPWESRAFGLALALHAGGAFEWEDFRQQLMAVIADWERDHGGGDETWSYYRCWLTALELVVAARGLVGAGELEARARELAARPEGHDHEEHNHAHG